MTPPTLQTLYRTLTTATAAEQVFGPYPADPSFAQAAIQSTYRTLALIAHPDKNPRHQALAAATFQLLEQWRTRALASIDTAPITLKTRKTNYTLHEQLAEGDYYALHRCTTAAGTPCTLKLTTDPVNNDLATRDAQTLRTLAENEHLARYLPTLIDTFLTDDGTNRRRATILQQTQHTFTLEQLRQHFPAGLDPRDAAWIFNRLLEALALAHHQNTIHAAPLPHNIIANLPTHGIELAEWAYSTPRGEPHTAIPTTHDAWYPPEVFAHKPATPATDIYLAAKTLLYLLGVNPLAPTAPSTIPAPIARLINACLLPAPHRRPQSAAKLHAQFRDALKTLCGPPRFRPLALATSPS